MKAVFMGTPDFAVGTLEALAAHHEVLAVFTQPDKPKGRGKAMQYTPVKEAAVKLEIPVYQPQKVRDASVLELLQQLDPEVIVVVAFGQIIPQSILDLPKYGCVNVHASLLPKYRGAAPIQWAVIDGEEYSGVTTMKMDAGLDTGDMLLKKEVKLAEDETGGSLFDKLSDVGAELLLETLDGLEKGTIEAEKQPAESPTDYAAMLTKKDGEIDWKKSAVEIERLVRGLNPWPSAYTHLEGKTLKIWKAAVEETAPGEAGETSIGGNTSAKNETKDTEMENSKNAAPGTIVNVTKHGFGIQTGNGILKIEELQLEGKKRMTADAFLRGFTLKEGGSVCS